MVSAEGNELRSLLFVGGKTHRAEGIPVDDTFPTVSLTTVFKAFSGHRQRDHLFNVLPHGHETPRLQQVRWYVPMFSAPVYIQPKLSTIVNVLCTTLKMRLLIVSEFLSAWYLHGDTQRCKAPRMTVFVAEVISHAAHGREV